MILNTAPQEQAILSNVGEIGEFRIRNSAKAFSILSSGLYANKVKAIVRELSCNAVDSHAAAGCKDTPFDVHLPNQLEPWFSIRDYGTGLSHEQVTQIYTTYFESTKTASNEFIGALGLGSKSPFSYTDNFTVTAIQNGQKGIYSAFINATGVPSIAQMATEDTTEPAGVEVKFAVNSRQDFDKFRQESYNVFKYFVLKPVVSGYADFKIAEREYDKKDIIPNVHQYTNTSAASVAIMGNIAYPIDVPAADTTLGDLRGLLNCGLEMYFDIGELDFQASREGLSYIPETINAIKAKLEAVNAVLTDVLKQDADAITNLWERALFLATKKDNRLWTAAVNKYAVDTDLSTFDSKRYGGLQTFRVGLAEMSKDWNIQIRGFHRYRGNKACSTSKASVDYNASPTVPGQRDTWHYWAIPVNAESHFVINDLKTGAGERAKYHYRESAMDVSSRTVLVLEPVDRTKSMNTVEFFKFIANPPEARIVKASSLLDKPRANSGVGRNVSIVVLKERGNGGYYRQQEMVWRDGGTLSTFDAQTIFYYLPLSGYTVESKEGHVNVNELNTWLKTCGVKGLGNLTIYGVRKTDIAAIKTQKNWVNIEDYISGVLKNMTDNQVMGLVMQALDDKHISIYNTNIVSKVIDPKSPYTEFTTKFKGVERVKHTEHSLRMLTNRYAKGSNFDVYAVITKFEHECKSVHERYPLLKYSYGARDVDLADYINLIDNVKGV